MQSNSAAVLGRGLPSRIRKGLGTMRALESIRVQPHDDKSKRH